MRTRLVLLGLSVAAAASAQYTYDYSKNPVVADSTRWSTNGSPTYSIADGVTFSGSGGGSLISQQAISVESGGSANDYEVNTTLALNSGGGDYIHFLRTSSGSVVAGSGSYISVELLIPSRFSGSGSATLNINECVSGTVTQLGSTSVTATNGMTLRSVIFGTTLWVFDNNVLVYTGTAPSGFSGNPGIGGYNMPSGSGILGVELGHHDTVAPNQINNNPIPSSVFPTSVSLKWQGVLDDANGIGEFAYYVSRNGVEMAMTPLAEFADSTVQPSTTYTYLLQAVDYHGNVNAGTSVTVTTPAAGAVDPRRVGLFSTGSYWGGAGEQIDTLSGNLHFSMPLLTAQGRLGDQHPVNMVYDSQNWRQDNGVNWELGNDVGYGFGWKVLVGSITPYFAGYWSPVDHFVYTDGTGAQYTLNSSSNGVWTSSTQSAYVWLDTTVSPYRLHFSDGSFWVMGSTSAGAEQDAGTMYPTIIEDRFGNQIIATYDTAAGLPYELSGGDIVVYEANTSARILYLADVRAITNGWGGGAAELTYEFQYDHAHYVIPHMTSFGNVIGTSEFSGTFRYSAVTQEPPFGTDPTYGGSVELLSTAPVGPNGGYQFSYDTAGAGELMSVIFPYGGEISWNYDSFEYAGSRSLREVSARYLAPDALHATSPMWSYGISRPDAPNTVTVHSAMTLTDASGIGAKTWSFTTSGSPWQIGLISDFQQLSAVGGNILHDDQYTWSQDPAGRPYISSHTSVTDEGQSYQESALTTQTLDQYGNVTQSVIYPYNNTTSPQLTYNNTYITSSGYTSEYIFNLLSTSSVTPAGGSQTTLVTDHYDTTTCYSGPFGGSVCGGYTSAVPTSEFDSNLNYNYRGMLSTSVTNTKAVATNYYTYGGVASVTGTDGTTATASASSGTNYSAPESMSVQNYSQAVGYNAFLGVTSATGANGEQLAMTYDQYGRPATATSPYGAVTTYWYNTSAPFTQTASGPSGVTITTLDGFGRATLVQNGDSATPDSTTSYTTTVYAPCACSPLGKESQASMPYPNGGSASAWTTWTYDGLGRPVSAQKPDGASTTNYLYQGNQTKVTDPAGNWKQDTKDVLGNLTAVVEPDPCVSGNTLTTSYTYNWMNQVTLVSMQRPTVSYSGTTCSEPGGSTTQTRTFAYDTGGRLTSATNPENGTVSYTYNSTNTLNKKTDAKGQATVYTYDSLNRVTEVQRYPQGTGGSEDVCQRVTYTYDTNPVKPSFSQNATGRLTTVQYSVLNPSLGSSCVANAYGSTFDTYTDMYSYLPAGAVTAKNVGVLRSVFTQGYPNDTTYAGSMEVDYTYDSAGRQSTVTYPMAFTNNSGNQPVLTMTYDAMGRPSALADSSGDFGTGYPTPTNWVSGVQYDYASRLTGLNYITTSFTYNGPTAASETRSYNANGQLASIGWPQSPGNLNTIQYVYSATQNNGQITQEVDSYYGQDYINTTSYQYDPLKRLTSAGLVNTKGTDGSPYAQTFQYDGFGNLTAKVLNGTTTPIAVNATTNQLTHAYYDANGNMTSGTGATFTYDEANRITMATETSGGAEYYGYDAANKRIYVMDTSQREWFTFYGAKGENLGKYQMFDEKVAETWVSFEAGVTNVWFGGRLVTAVGGSYTGTVPLMYQDRLGTNRYTGMYYPYGEGVAGVDAVQFATYTRSSYTGNDYADQRYYASTYGRYLTPDPMGAKAAKAADPVSWNRYSYTRGDPVNRFDPRGLDDSGYDCAVIFADASLAYNPNSYCSGAPGNCPDPVMAMALADSPDSVTFYAQAMASGCSPYTAAIIPAAAPATPSITFSISLYERPVYVDRTIPGIGTVPIFVGEHTYIDATAQLSTGAYVNFLCQGGPSGPNGTGNLVGSCTSGYNTMVNVGTSGPGLSGNLQVGGTYSCGNCGVVTQLLASVGLYASGTPAPYSATTNGGYNSNSYAFTLLEDVGLAGYNSSGSAWSWFGSPWLAPGWGLTVPGLGP